MRACGVESVCLIGGLKVGGKRGLVSGFVRRCAGCVNGRGASHLAVGGFIGVDELQGWGGYPAVQWERGGKLREEAGSVQHISRAALLVETRVMR